MKVEDITKKGTKVKAAWLSNEIGKVVYFDKINEMVDIKYPRSQGVVKEHISRVVVV